MKQLLLYGLVLILTACGTPQVSTPAPTPQAINIFYPPGLEPWADNIATCASKDPLVAAYFMQSEESKAEIGPNDIVLELGNPDSPNAGIYLSQVGWEQIVVIVNQESHLTQLSNDELWSIFSGQAANSERLSGFSTQAWVLPEGDATRLIFDQVVMQHRLISTEAMLAPDAGAMLLAVSQNSAAIGFLPGSFLTAGDPSFTSKVKIIRLESPMEDLLHQAVVAITQSEPEGLLRSLLVCLESIAP